MLKARLVETCDPVRLIRLDTLTAELSVSRVTADTLWLPPPGIETAGRVAVAEMDPSDTTTLLAAQVRDYEIDDAVAIQVGQGEQVVGG